MDTPQHVARSQQVKARLSLQNSWAYYQNLRRQEEDTVATGADIDAFRYGLERSPSLKKNHHHAGNPRVAIYPVVRDAHDPRLPHRIQLRSRTSGAASASSSASSRSGDTVSELLVAQADDFLYGRGENPFGQHDGHAPKPGARREGDGARRVRSGARAALGGFRHVRGVGILLMRRRLGRFGNKGWRGGGKY